MFRDVKTLQKFASVHASLHNRFNQDRHLHGRDIFKQNCSAVLAEWRQLAARGRVHHDLRIPVLFSLTSPCSRASSHWALDQEVVRVEVGLVYAQQDNAVVAVEGERRVLGERKDGAYGHVAIHVATLARADGPRVAAALAAKAIQE